MAVYYKGIKPKLEGLEALLFHMVWNGRKWERRLRQKQYY